MRRHAERGLLRHRRTQTNTDLAYALQSLRGTSRKREVMRNVRYRRSPGWAHWIVAFLAVPIVAASGPQAAARRFTDDARREPGAPDGWHQLLDAFVQHDSRAKELVDRLAQDSREPSVRALAAVLRGEWPLPRDSAALKRARPIEVPKLGAGAGKAHAESFVFNVDVSADGRVLAAHFARSPQQIALAKIARANVLRALFRPAFDGRQFVADRFVMKYSAEVR